MAGQKKSPPDEVSPDWNSVKQQLLERCKQAQIPVEIKPDEFFGESIFVDLPCGREKRRKWFIEGDLDLLELLTCQFENFTFLADYEAISRSADPANGTREIEAEIRSLPGRGGKFFKALQRSGTSDEPTSYRTIALKPAGLGSIGGITIGPPTPDFVVLCPGVPTVTPARVTIRRLAKLNDSHDENLLLLERLTNALFFQIEGLFGTPLALRKRRMQGPASPKTTASLDDLRFPETEYDAAPISLYFYANSAAGLPLVQFLGFYQTIEFYFAVCFSAEARRRIREIVKDPTFRFDREVDLMRILETIQGGAGAGRVSERNMLLATVRECVDQTDIVRFINADERRAKFLQGKNKELTTYPIPMGQNVDLLQAVADRIYDIRCRIVHTKSSDESSGYPLLLPNSKQAGMLHHDIALVQFVARKVLIYGSVPFKDFSNG